MKIERLVVEDGGSTQALSFHPGLTMVTGLDEPDRRRLANLLTLALGAAPPGLHVELVDGEGQNLAIFRPHNARQLVINVDTATDLTNQWLDPAGKASMLHRLDLDHERARELMHISRDVFQHGFDTGTDDHDLARRLGNVDPDELGSAVDELQRAEKRLRKLLAGEKRLSLSELDHFDRIETVHRHLVGTENADAAVRRRGFWTAGVAAIVAAGVFFFDSWTAKFLVVCAAAAVVITLANRSKVFISRRKEREVLQEYGFDSFEQFRERAGRFSDRGPRDELRRSTQAVLATRKRWERLAGEGASVDWYLANSDAVASLARARLQLVRQGLLSNSSNGESTNGSASHAANRALAPANRALAPANRALAPALAGQVDGARSIVRSLVAARQLGSAGESLPLVLDEIFDGSDAVPAELLTIVSKLSANHQFIVMTNNQDAIAWARQRPAGEIEIIDWQQAGIIDMAEKSLT